MKRNPAGTTIAMLAAGSGAVAAGLGGAWWWRRRRAATAPTKPPDLPSVDPSIEFGESRWSWGRANDPGYPWNKLLLHTENYPTPGMFFDVGDDGGAFDPSQGFDELVIALLASALTMAGWDPDRAAAVARAQGKDPDAGLGRILRRDVRRAIIEPDSWNDRLFGQTNANYAGGIDPGKSCTSGSTGAPCTDGIRDPNAPQIRYMMNASGRGLNWLPRHANVMDALGSGQTPARGTSLEGESLGSESAHMLLWMPAFDLGALAPPSPQIRLLEYPGSRSTLDPPPAATDLRVDMRGVVFPSVAA